MKNELHFIVPDRQSNAHMDESVVKNLIDNYLECWKNHEFHIGKIESKGEIFEVRAKVMGDIAMERIFVVDKHTGWVQSIQA
ncbi:MAG: hypothetical protein GX654_19070 [Desulfatiglans sp.]|jgi:hypothetical protein|nr:hypothetical protein [Desulfatiglans sp.]